MTNDTNNQDIPDKDDTVLCQYCQMYVDKKCNNPMNCANRRTHIVNQIMLN